MRSVAVLTDEATNNDGVLEMTLRGVHLHLDPENEDCYIDTQPDFDPAVARAIEQYIAEQGYEVMGEWECPPEQLSFGVLRHWLAERSDAHVLDPA